jgi:hypothetical protein
MIVCCVYSLVTGVGKWLPKWDFTSLQKASATAKAEIVLSGTVRVSLENRYVITSKKRFPCFVLGRGPRMSMETYSSGSEAGKSFRNEVRARSLILFFAHIAHCLTVSATSCAILGQKNLLLMKRNILVLPGCPAVCGQCSKWRSLGLSESGTTICFALSKGAMRTRSPSALKSKIKSNPAKAAKPFHSLSRACFRIKSSVCIACGRTSSALAATSTSWIVSLSSGRQSFNPGGFSLRSNRIGPNRIGPGTGVHSENENLSLVPSSLLKR